MVRVIAQHDKLPPALRNFKKHQDRVAFP
jgi:ribosomal protein S30